MEKAKTDVQTIRERRNEVRTAGRELARSLWRLGLVVTSSPLRLLPEETRQHLRSAGREAVRAGIALNRGALEASEKALENVQTHLDELEEKVTEAE
jgi:hypothetical protein